MAKPHEVQYINAYVSGSMAYQMDTTRQSKRATLPKAPKLTLMVAGLSRLQEARQENAALQNYVAQLQEENNILQDTYASSYDREEAYRIAQSMGMVPAEQVPTVKIEVSVPQLEEEPTPWQALCTFLTGLFA